MKSERWDRPPEDLTARARIRDAALWEFAEHGFRAATMRGVAEAAGVSVGLVQHHFGSKDGLRQACDDHVVAVLLEPKRESLAAGTLGDPDVLASLQAASEGGARYVARALVEDSDGAATLFDQMAATAEEFLARGWPDRVPPGSATARDAGSVMAVMHLGVLVLSRHLARRVGADPLRRDDAPRIETALLEVYRCMGDYLDSAAGQQVADAVDGLRDGHAPSGEED